tara:strand:+ start:853 stop:1026 length:174 start_codon:yes stop_codon:yes gene_type:complete
MKSTDRLKTLRTRERLIAGQLVNAMSMEDIEVLGMQLENIKLVISKEERNKGLIGGK